MLVSHRKHFIYTKVQKAASTSVELYFEPWCFPEGEQERPGQRSSMYMSPSGIIGFDGGGQNDKSWSSHVSARRLKEDIGSNIWYNYFKFCTMRNPYTQAVSWYMWIRHLESNAPHSSMSLVDGFRSWIQGVDFWPPRARYLIDQKSCMDMFIRVEHLAEDLRAVCAKLSIPFEPDKIGRDKETEKPGDFDPADFYDDETFDKVFKLCRWEVSTFCYTCPGR